MPSPLQPVRGTRDLIGDDHRRHAHVIDTARRVSATYGFDEWATPIFEDTAVFSRTLGDTSDVVAKEMYTFQDRGGDSVTLRPEGTAGICRALVTNGLTQSLPQKVFYTGPMFRYERPQKGRYRQFHQIGAELIGPGEPLADAEVIAMGWAILQALGIAGSTVLELNTLGDAPSRTSYRDALVDYFGAHEAELSPDSKTRLHTNPLRILDSKDPGDQRLAAEAPKMEAHLTTEAAAFFGELRHHLDALGVPFVHNPRIVRGLDYYNHTAFEFVTSALGAQGTVMGGGRYDGLVQQMGGPLVPAVGWAAGVERLAMLLDGVPPPPGTVVVVPRSDECLPNALAVVQMLRSQEIRAEMSYRGNLKRRMERANKIGATHVVLVGQGDETEVKTMATGAQQAMDPSVLVEFITADEPASPNKFVATEGMIVMPGSIVHTDIGLGKRPPADDVDPA